jgi:hypothetical protein
MLADKKVLSDRVLGLCCVETVVEKAGEFWADIGIFG